MNKGIVVLGAVFVDIKGYPFSTYIPAGRNAGQVIQVHGGVCRNVVENIANVELRPTFLSLVDDTGSGTEVIEKLRRHKVNTDYMLRTPDGMGTWLAVFDHSGDVVASISKRPDMPPLAQVLEERGDEIFSDCDSIVVEFDTDQLLLKKVFAYAERYHRNVYAVISNMSIALKRRDLLKRTAGFACNQQEAGILFAEDYDALTPEQMEAVLAEKVRMAGIPGMVVTMGGAGAVYADGQGNHGFVPAMKVDVKDTTGAGDAFFSGMAIGLTYGKTLREACEIGTRLAASVIVTAENVCPRFLPSEFGLKAKE